jgi:hypothetical protein
VQLGHAPIVHVLTASHCIGEMDFPIVPIVHISKGRRNATFCHDRVRLAEKRFANQPNGNARSRRFDCGAQTSTARADYENVVLKSFIFGHALENPEVVPYAH